MSQGSQAPRRTTALGGVAGGVDAVGPLLAGVAATRCDLGGRSSVGNQGAIAGASVGKKNSRSRCVKPRMLCPHTPFVTSLRSRPCGCSLDKPAVGETDYGGSLTQTSVY